MIADHITERDVLGLWLAGAFRKGMLRTEDGTPLQVEFAGLPSIHGGPDVRAARLCLGSQRHCGDVEIHLASGGWRRHGHADDGAYQNVVLHVALRREPGEAPRRPWGGRIPELVLESYLEEGAWAAVRRVRGLARPGSGGDAESDGAARFARRVERFRLLIQREDPDTVHYVETMRGLGFGPNKAAFAELARRVGRGADDPMAHWRAAARELPWNLQGVRPANQPLRRMEQFAPYAARTPRPFAELLRIARETADDRALVRRLAMRFGLGAQRALQIVFAVDLPMAATQADLVERMDRIDATHPPLAWTRPARLARRAGEPVTSVRAQSGLIERHRRLAGGEA